MAASAGFTDIVLTDAGGSDPSGVAAAGSFVSNTAIMKKFAGAECTKVGEMAYCADTCLRTVGFGVDQSGTEDRTLLVTRVGDGAQTLLLKTLGNARHQHDGTSHKTWVINPKAQPINELYGVMDPYTRDWTDGVSSKTFRELNQPLPAGKENELRWIIFDGDVDAICT